MQEGLSNCADTIRATRGVAPRGGSLRSFLFVNDLVPRHFGGGMRFIAELGRTARAQGIRMGILMAGEPIPLVAEAWRSAGISWWSLPDWKIDEEKERRWQFIKGFRRINALEPWDLVAFHHCNPLSVICACTWSRICDGRRFARVWHQHQGIPSPRGVKKYISTLHLLQPFMNAFVVNSGLVVDSFRERHCSLDKVKICYNGVTIPRNQTRGLLRPKLGLPASVRLLVTVASLIPRKGLDLLLHAFGQLSRECPEWHLVIVGGGPLLAELRGLSRQLRIDSRTHFLGISNNVPEILADCNAFVLPSRNEAMPVAILEAMASSLPVVATDVGCVRDVVVHGKTGLVVRPEDSNALGLALRTVFLDHKLAHDFGIAGRERAEQLFSLEQHVDDFLKLYREVCA
jgi:glycosyltransferase involved in cell wall biosynthesis